MQFLKNIYKFASSMKMMVFLVLLFGVASGVATFIENDYGTQTAKALVYSSWWFEVIMIVLGLNLTANIFRFKMYQRKKLPSFIFHLGFIVILIGAGVTRYIGFEGIMHIREGGADNRMLSSEAYIQIKAQNATTVYSGAKQIMLSSIGGNSFHKCLDIDSKSLCVEYLDFIPNAQKMLEKDSSGEAFVSLVVSTVNGPQTIMLNKGKTKYLDKTLFGFDTSLDDSHSAVVFSVKDGDIFVESNQKMNWYEMTSQKSQNIEARSVTKLKTDAVYSVGSIRFVPKEAMEKASIKVISQKHRADMKSSMNKDAVLVSVTYNGIAKEVGLFGKGSGAKGFEESLNIDGLDIKLEWGAKVLELPFKIHLDDFKMLKYAGSSNPSSYQSDITLIDDVNGVNLPYSIYMNHTLNYGDYRFFQSSYDPDEKGTVLSVNNDPGEFPTYLGYFLLTVGLFMNVLNPNSRFRKLAKAQKNSTIAIIAFGLLSLVQPSQLLSSENSNIIQSVKAIDKTHANLFGTIIIQDSDGRMKPIDTIANEILNKTARSNTILGLNANQVILGMITNPSAWQRIKMIKYSHPSVAEILGVTGKRFAFTDAFDYTKKQPYKLNELVKEAGLKKPAKRSVLDKDLLKIDERLNILYMMYTSKLLMMFPQSDDTEGTKPWLDPQGAVNSPTEKNAVYINDLLGKYLSAVKHGISSNEWYKADDIVRHIKEYQTKYGAKLMPDENHIKAEILFNNIRIFERLMPIYLLTGLLLLVLMFIKLIKTNMEFKIVARVLLGIFVVAFLAHTFGLTLRWYVSGHAPWSDGYESMIYIAWAIILAGIVFSKHSILALSSTGILAGITLFTAHLSWMDPQITNLVPVLKSYWLTLHVSIITASYGFLGLSALIGFITMLLIIIHNYIPNIKASIDEASRVNEMSMILGLSMLVVGNFLGGVWANESWGRYWGWDPKETWALVSILFYTAVVHLRFIKRYNNPYSFALASTVVFSSIIMTYFGVNYFLSGMHSYAAGDPMAVPNFAYYTVAVVTIIGIVSYQRYKKIYLK